MSEQPIVYGVWEHDCENDFLLGLYSRREDAEAHAAARNRRWPGEWVVSEHGVLDHFPGVYDGEAKGWHKA